MINILFISCYSIDINNSASIELIYYINLLASSGEFNVYLLTMDFPSESIYYDSDISKFVHKNVLVYRVKGGFILNKMIPKTNLNGINEEKVKKYNSALIKVKDMINIIDPYISWAYKAVNYFKKNLIDIKFDIVLGMHEPPSSLICAYKIKKIIKKFNSDVKLISYFSDPYCNEISRRRKCFFVRKINEFIEKKIVFNSNGFLFVTKNNFEYYKNKYGIDLKKVEIVHRSFDSNFYDNYGYDYPKEFEISKINFLYAGDIVKGMRDISKFIEALDFLKNNHKEKFEKLNLNFYGNINDDEQKDLVKSREYICFKPRLSYAKIINFIINSDVLLIFANKEFSQIPAKIYDYIGVNSYIMIIFEDYKDPLYELVRDVEGIICILNDCEKIANELLNFINIFNRGKKFNRCKLTNDNIYEKLKNVFI